MNTTHATMWMLFSVLLAVGSGGLGGCGGEARSNHIEESIVSKRANDAGREAMKAFMESQSQSETRKTARAKG